MPLATGARALFYDSGYVYVLSKESDFAAVDDDLFITLNNSCLFTLLCSLFKRCTAQINYNEIIMK